MSSSSGDRSAAGHGYETWRLITELGRWLPQPLVQQHHDAISGFVLTVLDRAWPRRCVVMSDAVGVEVLAEVLFAPARWEDVARIGCVEMSRRLASSIGVPTQSRLRMTSIPVAPVLAEILSLGAFDAEASWWVRALSASRIGRQVLLPEVAHLPSLSARLVDEFERASSSGVGMAQPSGWVVFKNELPVGAITSDMTWHHPAGSLDLGGRSRDAAAQCLLTIPAA